MKTSLTLLVLLSLLLGVYSNCNVNECRTELRAYLSNSYFCNLTDIQKAAIAAVRNCIYEEKEKKVCPEDVRNKTVELAAEIDAKYQECGLRQQRATCEGVEYFFCLAGFGNFAFLTRITEITEVSDACVLIKPALDTVDICKSCIGSFFGEAWEQVKDEVEAMWASATSLLGGACDCAARIQNTMNNIDYESTCRTVEYASKAAKGIAKECFINLVESFQTFDWLTMTEDFIDSVALYTDNACFFGGLGSPSSSMTVFLSSGTVLLATLAYFLNLANRT